MKNESSVFAPSSVSNIAVGFDILGFALDAPGDEIRIKRTDRRGIHITEISGAPGKIPFETQKNTAGVAALAALTFAIREKLIEPDAGFELHIHKGIPGGSGLGSSSASAVAGAFAVNQMLQNPLEKKQLLEFILQGEMVASGSRHADNVAPSLLGGMVLIRDNASLDLMQIPVPEGLCTAIVYPHLEILTKEARAMLSQTVPFKTVIAQCGNFGGFLASLFTGDYSLMRRSLVDLIVEPQRAKLIPNFYEAQRAALDAGAIGCSISGAGPSLFALCDDWAVCTKVAEALSNVFTENGIPNQPFCSKINMNGAVEL